MSLAVHPVIALQILQFSFIAMATAMGTHRRISRDDALERLRGA